MSRRARLIVVVLSLLLGWPVNSPAPQAASSTLVISSVLFDPYLTDEPEEAVELTNVSAAPIDLAGWRLSDNEGTVTFPSFSVGPGQRVWATKTATKFAEEFGFKPQFEYGSNSDPAVLDMTGSAPSFANSGDEVVLINASGQIVDVVVYKDGSPQSGWSGPTVQPYENGYFGIEGQILYRKLDQTTGLPVPDTDTASDWAQATDDNINGKKIQYPGWSLHTFFQTKKATESGELRVLVAPDHLFEEVRAAIDGATKSIDIEGYTIDNADLVDAIVARQRLGVSARVLLEGEPVSGISDQERWAAQQIEGAGGQVYLMHTDAARGIHDRYNYQHAKFIIIDDEKVLIGSENFGYSGMPADAKSDGTFGNRGTYLLVTAPSVVNHFKAIFADDLDPTNHKDLFRWTASHSNYGAPPSGFQPTRASGGSSYRVLKNAPLHLSGSPPTEVLQCPENCLRESDALIGLVKRAGPGDTILVEQLYEHKYWGRSTSNPEADRNSRLEAYINAARRGARVRILLDSFYDDPADPRGNTATAAYVNGIAQTEGIDVAVRLGNPTGNGIHNKMVLASIGSMRYVHLGSINGSENSNKNNREVAVQIESTDAYFYLEEVFTSDWDMSGDSPTDTSPPTAPTNLTARVSSARSNTVDLDWTDNPEADLSHYKVYVSGIAGGSYEFVATSTASAFSHFGLTQNQTYYYVVTAVDRSGNESGRSNEASVLVTPPAPAPSVTTVAVSGPASLSQGQSAQFAATATLSDGSTQTVTTTASWSSSNTNVATVSTTGSVTAVAPGQASIRATYRGVTGSASLTVTAPPSPTPSGSGVVINEFRTRGPQGANDEFIELRNDSSSSVDISGWSISGSDASGVTRTRVRIGSGVVLRAGCHYLATNSNSQGGPYSGGVDKDDTYSVGITDNGGIAVLRPDGTIVDAVGMSSGSAYKEGTPLADFGSTNSDRSYSRTGFDTNNNSADFSMISPSTPRNSSSSCAERVSVLRSAVIDR